MDAQSRDDFARAVGMLKAGDNEGAIGLLEKVIERSPGVTAPYIDIAQAYERVNKLEQAEQHLKTALGLVPAHPVASNEYGLLLRRTGRFAEARAVYEKTLAAFPEYLPARRNLGILCDLYLNDQTCALDQYEIYSKAIPGDAQVKMWVADLRLRHRAQVEKRFLLAALDQTDPSDRTRQTRKEVAMHRNLALGLCLLLLPSPWPWPRTTARKQPNPKSSRACRSSVTTRPRNPSTSFPGKAPNSGWRPA